MTKIRKYGPRFFTKMIYQNRRNTACNHKAMVQLSENQKVWALALREAGMKQKDVATRLGVSVHTIGRLEKRSDGNGDAAW